MSSLKGTNLNGSKARVEAFLKAIKRGDTTEALEQLANHDFLLSYKAFAHDGDSVWHLLAEYGDTGLIQALTNFCKIHTMKCSSRIRKQKEGLSQSEITIAQLINVGNNLRQTPLMFAAYHGRDEVVTILLQHGADPWAADRCGKRSALHYACLKGHAACVRALLEGVKSQKEGCRYVDVKSASGFTPLHFAVASNCVPAVRVLLEWDAEINSSNIFDAGEFWISCPTKTTVLHVAAICNRLHCAQSILHYYSCNKGRLRLDDPRKLPDKRGRIPFAIASQKGHDHVALVLEPGSRIEPVFDAGSGDCKVLKLKALAAKVVQAQLIKSIKDAEEFMKLLGTHQQHGRVFARLAYDSNQPQNISSNPESYNRGSPQNRESSLQEISTSSHLEHVMALGGAMGQFSNLPGLQRAATGRGGTMTKPRSEVSIGKPLGGGETSEMMGNISNKFQATSHASSLGATQVKDSRQLAIKQWLSYERKPGQSSSQLNRKVPLKNRSRLSQIKPEDSEQSCAAKCLASLRLGAKAEYLAPEPGDDVCGLCQDNKPLLQMEPCCHRTCLLCAKSLCYLLDLRQMVLCPFCGSLVMSFGLA